MLRYIYQGEVKIASEDLCNFREVADDLKIRSLSKESEKFSNSNDIIIPKNQNCVTEYRNPIGLKEHKETEHEGAIYKCEQCDYNTVQTLTLRIHIKTLHEGISYQCDQCDVRVTQMQSLKRHIDAVHEKIINPCDKCDKEYTDMGGP